jgi:hypothetical protein
MTRRSIAAASLAAVGAVALLVTGCAQPARMEEMSAEPETIMEYQGPPELATLHVTVYGDDVGGFASHYYPLPRADFEAALLDTIARSELFAASPDPAKADYAISVGLISLVAPQWSGTVTLETSWAVSDPRTGSEIARHMIKEATPSPFAKKREATEAAASANIETGLEWLQHIIENAAAPDDQG